jgi:hypothetical protein
MRAEAGALFFFLSARRVLSSVLGVFNQMRQATSTIQHMLLTCCNPRLGHITMQQCVDSSRISDVRFQFVDTAKEIQDTGIIIRVQTE